MKIKEKFYPASEVTPLRSMISDTLRKQEVGSAFNVGLKDRQRYITAISRLHNRKEGKWRTMKISSEQIAIVRLS